MEASPWLRWKVMRAATALAAAAPAPWKHHAHAGRREAADVVRGPRQFAHPAGHGGHDAALGETAATFAQGIEAAHLHDEEREGRIRREFAHEVEPLKELMAGDDHGARFAAGRGAPRAGASGKLGGPEEDEVRGNGGCGGHGSVPFVRVVRILAGRSSRL